MQSREIRDRFLKFFEERGHKVVPSSSLVPENDPSVLFTTAGMQQFKPYFIGAKDAQKDFNTLNLASSQKCMRTSDIEEVGDASHLTFFEMLGNFSFGGYWKKEAIEYAYEFVTKVMGLKIDYVTVFEGEGESEEIWKAVDPKLVIKKAGKADNFWGPTGDEGPCGPTTEIYVDGIEVWNIVFNEYYQDKTKSLTKLAKLGVDTGMGLERLVRVVQGKETVFETDLFEPVMKAAGSRIVADHIRTACFIIADGAVPDNTGRGYVLRRLLRRAYVRNKDIDPVIDAVVSLPSYQGLYTFAPNTKVIIGEELEKFKKTLDAGLKQVEKGANPFILFTTYGLPLEIIKEVAQVDEQKFKKQMEGHQNLSRTGAEQKFKIKL